MRNLVLSLLLLVAPAIANADTFSRTRFLTAAGSPNLLSAVAANASSGTRTVTVTTGGYARLTWVITLSWHQSTFVTMTCKASNDNGTNYGDITGMAITGGTGTLTPFTWSRAVGASAKTVIDMPVATYDAVQCIFSATSGDGTDLLTVTATAGAP